MSNLIGIFLGLGGIALVGLAVYLRYFTNCPQDVGPLVGGGICAIAFSWFFLD